MSRASIHGRDRQRCVTRDAPLWDMQSISLHVVHHVGHYVVGKCDLYASAVSSYCHHGYPVITALRQGQAEICCIVVFVCACMQCVQCVCTVLSAMRNTF